VATNTKLFFSHEYPSPHSNQSSALWAEKHKDAIKQSLTRIFNIKDKKNIIWKQSENRLKMDGMSTTFAKDNSSSNDATTTMVIKENGIQYRVQPHLDQKTGFYCDQRQNRLLIRSLTEGRNVLDAYCYSGGFAMNAVLGGATHKNKI